MSSERDGEFWTMGDLAKRGEVVPATARSWVDRGLVPCVRTPNGVRLVRREDGERLLRERAKAARS
jgi:DNA-binding transcriptional MerR regulator